MYRISLNDNNSKYGDSSFLEGKIITEIEFREIKKAFNNDEIEHISRTRLLSRRFDKEMMCYVIKMYGKWYFYSFYSTIYESEMFNDIWKKVNKSYFGIKIVATSPFSSSSSFIRILDNIDGIFLIIYNGIFYAVGNEDSPTYYNSILESYNLALIS